MCHDYLTFFNILYYKLILWNKNDQLCLEVLAQLANAEIARPDVVTQVRTQDLIVVCEFNISGLSLHLRPNFFLSIMFKTYLMTIYIILS